jgi:hypothetical protein
LTPTAAPSFAPTGSYVDDDAVAVFVTGRCVVTVAAIAAVAVAAFASPPMIQTPEPALYEPCDGDAETNAVPAGNGSVTATLLAVSGPLLVTVTVKVTLPPTGGVARFTVFVTARSALGTSTGALEVLFAATASCVALETVAVLIRECAS